MKHAILTSKGVDGSCAAAFLVQKFPESVVHLTTGQRLAKTLKEIKELRGQFPRQIHICNLFIDKQDPISKDVVQIIQKLPRDKYHITYYNSRSGETAANDSLINLTFANVINDKGSTAELIFSHFGLSDTPHNRLLKELSRAYVDGRVKQEQEHWDWLDLIEWGNDQFFRFGNIDAFRESIRILSGVDPFTETKKEKIRGYLENEVRFLGNSSATRNVLEQVNHLIKSDSPVLIQGAIGAGRELVAREIHYRSTRASYPFITVVCGGEGVNPTSDLTQLIHSAGQGTLFFDEVGDLSKSMQALVMRAIDNQPTPTGDGLTQSRSATGPRIIASTSKNLIKLVQNQSFRADLYFKLNVLPLNLPSLGERRGHELKSDLREIAMAINRRLVESRSGIEPLELKPKDWKAIENYSWPGNIRQFINVFNRAACFGKSFAETLKEEPTVALDYDQPVSEQETVFLRYRPKDESSILKLEDIKQDYAHHIHEFYRGRTGLAAEALGISFNTMQKLMRGKPE